MPENNQDIQSSIDDLNDLIAKNASDLVDARAYRDRTLAAIDIDKGWFEEGRCKWKPGRKSGVPESATVKPTSGSSDECGWRKERYFNNLNIKSSAISRVTTLESETDELELALSNIF